MDKKYACGVIQDLLPLYHDEICSEESKIIIKEHLNECEDCRRMAELLEKTQVEEQLYGEKAGILKKHAKKEKARTTIVGMVTAGILMVPIVICLICNLAIGHGLDWFFIVLASILVVASVTVVPMMKDSNQGLWTLGSFSVAIVVLFGVINIYTSGTWFLLASIATLFGLTILFLPYVLYKSTLPSCLQNKKGLLAMLVDTVFLYLLIYICSFYSNSVIYYRVAFGTVTFCSIFAWIVFLTIRYLPFNGFIRAGLVFIETGLFGPFIDGAVDFLIHGTWAQTQSYSEANTLILVQSVCIVIGFAHILAGIWNRNRYLEKEGDKKQNVDGKR